MTVERATPLFDFKLMDVGHIPPWGKPGAHSLSWFGLTLGWYWLNVGDQQLLVSRSPSGALEPIDYQVVRLWEDVLEMLPEVLEPVPPELASRLEPSAEWVSWRERAWNQGGGHDHDDRYRRAVRWARRRTLDVAYLNPDQRPEIIFCRVGDTVRILWDLRHLVAPPAWTWTATSGRMELPVATFVAEVTGLHERLMAAMSNSLHSVQNSWSRPDVAVDLAVLDREQQDRSTWLAHAVRASERHSPTDWSDVAAALVLFDDAISKA